MVAGREYTRPSVVHDTQPARIALWYQLVGGVGHEGSTLVCTARTPRT